MALVQCIQTALTMDCLCRYQMFISQHVQQVHVHVPGSVVISDTIYCFRLDGFPQPMWTKRECSEKPTFADLAAPYKSGTIFYLLCSEKRTHSLQEINIRQKKCFCCFVLSGYSFFSECFYPVYLLLCISFAFDCVVFGFWRMSCLISVQERRKKNWLAVCVLLQRLY